MCFFGSYDRNAASPIKLLLQNQNVKIDECQEDVYSIKQLIKAYVKLMMKHRKLEYDVMIVPWRGIMTLPLAKLIKKGPILFFPYIPLYDSVINDRKMFKKNSIQGKILKFADGMACKIADLIILDNFETIDYFCSEYGSDKKKFRRLITGANEDKFVPLQIKKPCKIFNVFFLGTFIPFHGVDILVEAARILSNHDDIKFILCGDGTTRKENEKLAKRYGLKNIQFLGYVDFFILKQNLDDADVGIGILASGERRTNATPNKIFEILASSKPLITRDLPVMKELLLKNNENCILVKPGEPQDLADAILKLKNDPRLAQKIAINGYETYKKIANKEKVVKQLISYIEETLS